MCIKDYLVFKEIENYLEVQKNKELADNGGYSNLYFEEVNRLLENLKKILLKYENKD